MSVIDKPDTRLGGYTDRVPKDTTTTTPISEIVADGQQQQVIKRKIVYDMRPLAIICGTVVAVMFLWAAAFTIGQVSNNATARACFAASGNWQIDDDGNAECLLNRSQ